MRISDWSSDVCSSDLEAVGRGAAVHRQHEPVREAVAHRLVDAELDQLVEVGHRVALGAMPLDNRVVERAVPRGRGERRVGRQRSEEHTSELQSLMRISYAVFCLKKKNKRKHT